MNGVEVARALNMPAKEIYALLDSGAISATKEKGKWLVTVETFDAFNRKNKAAIQKLKKEFCQLYREGLSPEQLQRRVKAEFEKRGIVANPRYFAEKTIYESLMAEKAGA